MGTKVNGYVKKLRPKEDKLSSLPSNKNGYQNSHYSDALQHHQPHPTCRYLYYRVFGYSIGVSVHLVNILAMRLALRGPIMKDPDVEHFYSMQFFYITIWNLIFQLFYIGMGLACDLPILMKMNNSNFLHWLRRYRKTYYNGLLFPCGIIIFLVYWPIYTYDRNLIFPDYIDKVLSPVSNYIMHMFIAFPIVWDLFFLPNQKPSSEKYTIAHSVGLYIMYHIALFGLYHQRGKWPYPILKLLHGSIYFPLLFISITILLSVIYSSQWSIISYVWRKNSVKST